MREEVISIVCREELDTRSLPDDQIRYLIGMRYNADTIIEAHNAAGTDQFKEHMRRDIPKGKKFYESNAGRIKERLAREYHLNSSSIIRYSCYAQAIDHIASIRPDMADKILADEMKVSIGTVIGCYGQTEDEVVRSLAGAKRSVRTKKDALEKEMTGVTVKDMPAFDPDAKVNSLALTIPYWISSIERTRSGVEFSLMTSEGRDRLEQQMSFLQKTVEKMLYTLKEIH